MKLLTPPQAVIYSRDMEPITVILMKPWYWEQLHRVGHIRFAVRGPLKWNMITQDDSFDWPLWEVNIYATFIRNNHQTGFILLNTDDETAALMMDADFVPGQQRKLQEEKKKAFAEGFVRALSKIR